MATPWDESGQGIALVFFIVVIAMVVWKVFTFLLPVIIFIVEVACFLLSIAALGLITISLYYLLRSALIAVLTFSSLFLGIFVRVAQIFSKKTE